MEVQLHKGSTGWLHYERSSPLLTWLWPINFATFGLDALVLFRVGKWSTCDDRHSLCTHTCQEAVLGFDTFILPYRRGVIFLVCSCFSQSLTLYISEHRHSAYTSCCPCGLFCIVLATTQRVIWASGICMESETLLMHTSVHHISFSFWWNMNLETSWLYWTAQYHRGRVVMLCGMNTAIFWSQRWWRR